MKNKEKIMENIEKNIIIDNDYLQKYIKTVSVCCENCEYFEIDISKIVDIYFDIAYIPDKNNNVQYKTKSGKLEIHESASKAISSFYDETSKNVKEDYYLIERLNGMSSDSLGCDVCVLGFEYHDGKYISVYPPYDALENVHCSVIEMSNCPSFDVLKNNNMLLLFGEDSKSPKRIDNNYDDLIIGWKEYLKDRKRPEILEVEIISINNLENDCRAPRLFINVQIGNNHLKNDSIEIVFEDFSNLSFDLDLHSFDKSELHMSRLVNGRIFVKFEGIDLEFECASIRTYNNYCDDKITRAEPNDEVYYKALNLEINENDMRTIAHCHFAMEGDLADISLVKRAINKLKENEISMTYFKNWLKFYSEVLVCCREFNTEGRRKANQLALLLDRLFINIAYDNTYLQAKTKIESMVSK